MIVYKGGLIRTGSQAYELWLSKDWQALDKHLARLRREAQARGEIQ